MKDISTNNEVYQFIASCVSYPKLRQNKAFKEKIDKCLSHQFDEKTSASIRGKLKQDNNSNISI